MNTDTTHDQQPLHIHRRQDDTKLEGVLEKITSLKEDVSELKDSTKESMKEISLAISKLVLIEERQSNTNEAFNRLLKQLDVLDDRIKVLEKAEPLYKLVAKWVLTAVWGAVVLIAVFVGKFVGLI